MRSLLALLLALSSLLGVAQVPEESVLRAHMAFLADDVLQGRGTGQRGGDLAVRYLEAQLQALGLRPASGASYRQTVKLAGVHLDLGRSALTFSGASGSLSPGFGTDLVIGPAAPQEDLALDAPLVFVGHGIAAEDGSRDDYKGFDARGKVLVMLVGARKDSTTTPDPCSPAALQGRWTTKFEEARRHGAAGVLLVHTTSSASYGWDVVQNGWTGERFQLDGAGAVGTFQGWLSQAMARRICTAAGKDLEALTAAAERPDFHPVPLAVAMKGTLHSKVRTLDQWNVAGVLQGSDPRLKDELVIFSAHWDHFGVGPAGQIYHGAVDNASGCAGVLSIARALAMGPAPRRSVMFLFPCGEEQGLLGSSAYVASPLWPLRKTVLVLNLESLNFAGPTRDIGLLGTDEPGLRALCARAASVTGLVLSSSRPDPAGLCFRSDHFPFMRAGVPALSPGFSLDGGWDYLGDKAAAQARAAAFMARYHHPEDTYDPVWNLEGMLQQVRFALELGRLAAMAPLSR